MDSQTVHHLEFGVLDGPKYVQKLVSQFHFQPIGRRATPAFKQWVVSSSAIRFLITELLGEGKNLKEDPYVHSWAFTADKDSKPVKEAVFNIAFRVKDIESWVTRSSGQNVQLIKPLQTVSDEFGFVRVCMVKSCVGNIVHTLVDDSGYSGPFLPGFQTEVDDGMSVHTRDEEEAARFTRTPSESVLDFLDHVAMYIPCGSSGDVISWYEKCFGMTRFFVTREDDVKEGLVVACDANLGVRLKVLEFSKDTDAEEKMVDPGDVKLITAEKLPESGPDQIDTFFANHGGPGVGHVALHTKDLISTVSQLRANGAKFGPVPYTYYTEAGRLKEMIAIGVDVDLIKKNKILIDLEEEQDVNHSTRCETDHNESNTAHRQRYLMQIFTQPLSKDDSFYLELIQRVGAIGFGSENVKALRRSMQAYLDAKEAAAKGDQRDVNTDGEQQQ